MEGINMKICIVTLAEKGGMIHYATELSNAISKTESIHMVISEDTNKELNNLNITRIPVPRKYMSLKTFQFNNLINSIKEINPDLVHITSIHPWLIFALPFLSKYPIIATIHDVKMHEGERSAIWTLSQKILIKYADKIFVHGEKSKNTLLKMGVDNDKLKVIPHGDYSFFTKYNGSKVEDETSILFFGRIVDYKGIEFLIKSLPLIIRKDPDLKELKIIIAGEGDFKKYTKLIKNPLNFEIHNRFIPDEEVAEFFQRAKIVVLPYNEASQSGIIPIAYSFKKPVVVTNVGDISEIVEDGITGITVPPKNEEALAIAIVKLLRDNDLRKEMGEKAYQKMKDKLSWADIANKTIKTYKEILIADS
jgi:starch synthase